MSNFCQDGTNLDTQEKISDDKLKFFHKIFKKWVDDRAKEQNVKYTEILKKIKSKFDKRGIILDDSTFSRWYSGTRKPSKYIYIQIISEITGISIEEYFTGKRFTDTDKDYLDKIEIDEGTANHLYDINIGIHWNNDNLITMEKLELDSDTSTDIVKINTALKRSPLPLLNLKSNAVTLSEIICNCVSNKGTTFEVLKMLSDILNNLKDWNYEEKAPDLLDRLNDYGIAKPKKYEEFYKTIPKEIREKINRVEEDVSNMIKYYILDDFINNNNK